MWTSAVFAATFFVVVVAIGDVISTKTKGFLGTVLFVITIYIAGYFTGLIPKDAMNTSGFLPMITSFGMLLIVTNLGTMINLNQLLVEWKTVVTAIAALLVLGVVCIGIGTPLFGREWALAAYPPVSGGTIAAVTIETAAQEAGNTQIGPFAWLLISLQLFVGIPVAILCLILGILFCEIGFLDRNALQTAGVMNFIMLSLIALAPNSFATLDLSQLLPMLVMAAFFLLAGGAGLAAGGAFVGKLMKIPPKIGACIGLNAMVGFPFNLMVTEDIVHAMDLDEEDSEKLREIVLPKMVVAGFTTVTVTSVIIASIVAPIIFS